MKTIKKLLRFIILVILIIAGINIYLGYDKYKNALSELSLDTAVENAEAEEHYTNINEVPKIYKDAVVAVEDRRFYQHNGFDIIGTGRAIINDIKQREFVEGGSTITQQLAKNMYFPGDFTATRKIAEIFMALKIEREYSKDKILELYFNGIYYGSGYYNIYDAAKGYFGTSPSKMNNHDATLLAGIPNAPSVYSPDNNPELAKQRQEKVLKCMVECKYISEDEKSDILLEK